MSVRMAVAGLGGSGWEHCEKRILSVEGLELACVCDTDSERLARARTQFGVKGYSDYREMLSEGDFDAVVITTPTSMHAPMALQAIEAGRSLIVEKPMCLNRREADSMLEAASAKGAKLTVYHNRRWDIDYLHVMHFIRSGVLGRIMNAEFRGGSFAQAQGWRGKRDLGGGILYDWGSHNLDQMLRLADARPVDVYGIVRNYLGSEVDNYVKAVIRFENGIIGQLERSCFYRTPLPKCLVVGELGAAGTGWEKIENLGLQVAGVSGSFAPTKGLPQSNPLEFYQNFRDVILGKASSFIVTPEQAREVILAIDAIRESSRTGQVVKWAA